ncbi:hypothetical protein P153DRAFT_371559 [Dothidotthia symphoricarpi CBS 119687]|uniref:Uncharacterized protein n=1 Tax=Dothidotthia symphoricarpi CBS 119687 TaxID=1392245 RepID=A0A6A5ZXU4_9PLEO|nr:uncharacterized protein P153DRAFT_371559 [Dothidotthia symphoricarpi CBS 119687]KAF2123587.1 hypothetical protein P153DRAFT_371559 [Dothidotthia symphoricarpi CBS 119687]
MTNEWMCFVIEDGKRCTRQAVLPEKPGGDDILCVQHLMQFRREQLHIGLISSGSESVGSLTLSSTRRRAGSEQPRTASAKEANLGSSDVRQNFSRTANESSTHDTIDSSHVSVTATSQPELKYESGDDIDEKFRRMYGFPPKLSHEETQKHGYLTSNPVGSSPYNTDTTLRLVLLGVPNTEAYMKGLLVAEELRQNTGPLVSARDYTQEHPRNAFQEYNRTMLEVLDRSTQADEAISMLCEWTARLLEDQHRLERQIRYLQDGQGEGSEQQARERLSDRHILHNRPRTPVGPAIDSLLRNTFRGSMEVEVKVEDKEQVYEVEARSPSGAEPRDLTK